jgi:tetratricopeptide (TPR) repeat protein
MTQFGIVDFFKRLFPDTWAFLFAESKICFTMLVIIVFFVATLFMLFPYIDHFRNSQTQRLRRIASDPFAGRIRRFCGSLESIFVHNRLWTPMIGLAILVIVHLYATDACERLFLTLNDDDFGILICRFPGPDLQEYFGPRGISGKIANDIGTSVESNLRDRLKIQFSNKSFDNAKEAEQWCHLMHAKLTLWGHTEASRDSILAHVEFAGVTSIAFKSSYDVEETEYGIRLSREGEWEFSKIALTRDRRLANWISDLALFCDLNGSLALNDWPASISYLNRYRSSIDSIRDLDCFSLSFIEAYCHMRLKLWDKCLEKSKQAESCLVSMGGLPGTVHTGLLCQSASSMLALGDTMRALQTLKAAVDLQEGSLQPYAGLSHAYKILREYDSAARYAKRGLSIAPENVELNKRMGLILVWKGMQDEAIPYFRKALQQGDTDRNLIVMLCLLYLNNGFPDSCLAISEPFRSSEDSIGELLLNARIVALVRCRRLSEAGMLLDEWTDRFPCLSVRYLDLAREELQGGDTLGSSPHFKRFGDLNASQIEECCRRLGCGAQHYWSPPL